MFNLLKLGLRDLPLDEVILIKTIFRLSRDQLSSQWEVVDGGAADAWIADSASWSADRARQARGEHTTPTLYLSRLQNLEITPVLMRPIRAQALVQWLEETAHAVPSATVLAALPVAAVVTAPAAAAVVADEHGQWAATEPSALSFMESISVAQASTPAVKVEPLVLPEPFAKAEPLVRTQSLAVAESVGQSVLGASADILAAQQLDPDSRYLLRRWPPAQIMGNDPKRLRITSLLSKQALQVDELSNLSGASVEECEGWMSTLLHSELLDTRAAAVAGAGHSNAEKLSAKSASLTHNRALVDVPKRTSSLVSAIRRRLGI